MTADPEPPRPLHPRAGVVDADARTARDRAIPHGTGCVLDPHARAGEVLAVEGPVDPESDAELPWAAREVLDRAPSATPLHPLDTFQRLERADEDRVGDVDVVRDHVELV